MAAQEYQAPDSVGRLQQSALASSATPCALPSFSISLT